jgi:hypothetical protein
MGVQVGVQVVGVAAASLAGLPPGAFTGVAGALGQGLCSLFFKSNTQRILDALDVLQTQLTSLQTSVYSLQDFVGQQFTLTDYTTQVASLSTPIANIQAAWGGDGSANAGGGYVDALQALSVDPQTGAIDGGLEAGGVLATLIPSLDSVTLATDLQAIQDNQLGLNGVNTSLISLLQQIKGTRYLTNVTIEPLLAQYNSLAALQRQAATMLSTLRTSETPPNLTSAAQGIKESEDSIQQQSLLLPFPMPDDHILYDRESGLIFSNEVFAAVGLGEVNSQPGQMQIGNIGIWRLANPGDLQSLIDGGVLSAPYDQALKDQYGVSVSAATTTNNIPCSILNLGDQNVDFSDPIVVAETERFGDGFACVLYDLSTGVVGEAIICAQSSIAYMLVADLSQQDPRSMTQAEQLAFGVAFDSLQVQGGVIPDQTESDFPSFQVTVPGGFTPEFEFAPYFYWESSDETIATISNGSDTGKIRYAPGSQGGSVTFTGKMSGLNVSGSPLSDDPFVCTITFELPEPKLVELSSIYIAPHYTRMQGTLPQSQQLFLLGQYNDGSSNGDLLNDPIFGSMFTFSSSDPNVTVSPSGLVTANAAPANNKVTITATFTPPSSSSPPTTLDPGHTNQITFDVLP